MIRDLCDPGAKDVLARHGRYWRNGQFTPEPWHPTATFAPAGGGDSRPLFQLSRAAPMVDTPDPHTLQPPPLLDGKTFRERVERDYDTHGLLDGDYFRVLGTGIASEVFVGCQIKVRGGTHWAENCFTDFRQLDNVNVRDTIWYRRLIDNTRRAVDSVEADRYPFGCCAFRGPVDMVEAMMGGAAMCEAAVDDPEGLKHLLARITDIIIDVGQAHAALLPPCAGGSFNSYRIWTPGRTVTFTLDGACLFSPAHYEQLFLPFDQRLCEAFETPFVHLHAAARQHFQAWTEIPSLGLQCVIDQAFLPEGHNQPIGPQIPDLMEAFSHIRQQKSLMLYGYWTEAWLRAVLEGLPVSGCAITGMTEDPESLHRALLTD
ncbi:MAG TPA: hypothetical protein QF604_06840 [Candidatus Latescibacteria bacterium]|jgi:hypothetical protein|nr:hypothetical protein [Candidatus Latescibacterota bacterium]HCV22089.1 hypothetical protein [Candidatus Latescibacterota bacterium]HJN27616.1 hypothetical protein [Candidatus Latescibacterota bacterium]|tara:strand:- start:118 stop:1239 length:1122 start_codon:yes stop_codon:yes gene_type:complete